MTISKKNKVVVIGGGTGSFTLLTGLKKYPLDLTAVVAMADDGGSTGILRDELGVLPPGDVRQCLVALSTSDTLMRALINYRFQSGGFKGHSFGNLLLSALEKVTGSFDGAVEKASDILRLKGKVAPGTLDKVQLIGEFKGGKKIIGESAIRAADLKNLENIYLEPKAKANPKAATAIGAADLIIVAPGDFYASTVPNFLVQGIASAIKKSKAPIVYVCNLMTKRGHTDGFTPASFAERISGFIGRPLDFVIYNNTRPPKKLLEHYAREGETLVSTSAPRATSRTRYIGANLLNTSIRKAASPDLLERNLIRHHSGRIASLIFQLLPLRPM